MKILAGLFISILLVTCSPRLSPDYDWGYARWVVIELRKVPVQLSGGRRDAHLVFYPAEKRFAGYGGCNQISGNYSVEKRERIKFDTITSTKMSCPDLAFENTFLGLLNEANRFEEIEDRILLKKDRDVLVMLQRQSN